MIKRSTSLLVAALTLLGSMQLRTAVASAETTPEIISMGNGVVAPWGHVIQGPDRTLYGSTHDGGVFGTVYKAAPGGAPQAIYTFPHRTDGTDADAPVIQGVDGRLYGTTSYEGGTARCGTVFAVNPDGSGFTVLHTFTDSDGCIPVAGLVQADDGYLYGTASQGGPNHLGDIFKLAPDGTSYQVLHMFTNVAEGANPRAGLIEGNDGRLYGTTFGGGPRGGGIVFAIKPDGSGFTTIYGFGRNVADGGANPRSGVVQGADGTLYGTASASGQYGQGSAYKVTLNGTFTVLHAFGATGDGKSPHAELLLASDGRLYGTAASGGSKQAGLVFSVGTDGSGYAVVHTFVGGASDGSVPEVGLIQADDGQLVGATTGGGVKNAGTIYKLNLGLPKPMPAVRLINPVAGYTGASILIHGRYFVGATGVAFNGAQATFTTPSAEWIRAIVPADATSGPVTVTSPAGTATAAYFKVIPTISALSVTSGDVGQRVVITGKGFSGVKSVAFHNASASFTIDSPTQITTTVPAGASTGPVTVTTSDSGAASPMPFTFTGQVQPTPTATTPAPTGTPVSQPAITITYAGVAHMVKGKMAATTRLKSNEKGFFTLRYNAQNAGSGRPTATLTILSNGQAMGSPLTMVATTSIGLPAFRAAESFKTQTALHLTAQFTITLGSSHDTRTADFMVTKK